MRLTEAQLAELKPTSVVGAVLGAVSIVAAVITIYSFTSGKTTLLDALGVSRAEPPVHAVTGEIGPPNGTRVPDAEAPAPPRAASTPTDPPSPTEPRPTEPRPIELLPTEPRAGYPRPGRWYIRVGFDESLEGTSPHNGGALHEAARAVRLWGQDSVAIFKFNGNWATMVGPYPTEEEIGAAKPEIAEAWGRRVAGNDMTSSKWCSGTFVTRPSPAPSRFDGPIYVCE